MTRPITVVYQEQAAVTPTVSNPDLNTIVIGPAYQIFDYADDKASIEVSAYGTLNGDNPYTAPVANTPAIVLAAPPGIAAGAWVDPTSIKVYFDDLRVIMASRTDGATTVNDNLLTSAGATFVTSGVAAGDYLIIDNPVGPATPNLVLTISEVVSNTQVRVTTNFLATVAGTLKYRVERRLDDQQVGSAFVVPPTYGQSNAITILGGVTITVGGTARTVAYARVYVAHRAFRTDLQSIGSIDSGDAITQIKAKIGKIDSRNPLAAHVWVASQNAGQAPIYFFGVPSDDLVGYTSARDALSNNKAIYHEVLCKADATIAALFKADNVSLADPVSALANGIPQKFRTASCSAPLVTTQDVVLERNTATTEQKTGAIPPGVRTITFNSPVNFYTAGVKPGDLLILTASANASPLDGSYAISHLNSATSIELDTALPTTVASPEGANLRVYRPSLGTDVIANIDNRARLTIASVTYYARVAGSAAGARTIALVENATTAGGIYSVVEVPGVSTVINANFASGLITAQKIVDAITSGSGVTTPFTGSQNLVATTSNGATVQAAAAAAALSTGTAGVNSVASTGALDAVYIRLFDSTATFISSGVLPGDILEIPSSPNGVFGATLKRYTVGTVLSEQRIEISDVVSGSYVNNSSTVESELPHLDDRLGDNLTVTQGSIRYKVIRELSKDQQVTSLITVAQSLRSQRAIMAWPDSVQVAGLVDGSKTRNLDGSAASADPQPGTYLAAVVGGMTAGLPNHQGFSRLGCAGISRIYHSNDYFTARQITQLSDGGWYVFMQDTPESLPYCVHQLTTDPSSLQSGEYSMVKNFDFLSKFFVSLLDPFLGIWNVNEETLGFMRQALSAGIQQLKLQRIARIGAPLIDASIVSLDVSTASTDRVEIYMNVTRPTPLNVIGLHLVG